MEGCRVWVFRFWVSRVDGARARPAACFVELASVNRFGGRGSGEWEESLYWAASVPIKPKYRAKAVEHRREKIGWF